MKLSTLSVLLGLGMGLPQIYGIVNPQKFAASVRRFPRNVPVGVGLMLLGTAWFLWNLNQEAISDFSNFKPYLMTFFGAVGLGTCIYVHDFLAVRDQRGSADTEELRKAVVHYRALFDELLEVRVPKEEIAAAKRVA
jgi:hypothetical protein